MPKLSIIIPVYNLAPYIECCLESVLAQTFVDWEAIVVDDGSTDSSGAILDRFAEQDDRIRVFHIVNGGVSNARNMGLREARGEYIGFVDGDDWIEPGMYEALLNEADAGADIVQCEYDCVYEDGRVDYNGKNEHSKEYLAHEIIGNYLTGNIYSYIFCKIFCRELIRDIAFDVNISIGEDSQFIYEACARSRSVIAINGIYYHYRIRNGSAVHRGLCQAHFDVLNLVDALYADLKDDSNLLRRCVRRESVACMDLINAVLKENVYYEKLPELRSRIISKKRYIFGSSHFSVKFQCGVLLLWLCPGAFYYLYRKR